MSHPTAEVQCAAPLARFAELVPYQSQHADNGIPREVMEYLAANKVFPVVSPAGLVGRNALARLRGWPGLCITIAECVPGHGPVSHNHTGTLENFFCLDGGFDVKWGNRLEHKVSLAPGDLVSVPPGIYRTFQNTTGDNARLLVMIQGDRDMSDKIEMPRAIGEEVRQKHGERVLDLLAAINMRFQGGETPDFTPEQMSGRVARAARLHPRATTDGETVYPVMVPVEGVAPVTNWPGLDVSLMVGEPGVASTAQLDADHCQWIVNLGEGEWMVDCNGERSVLGRFDIVCAEAGTTRTVRNLSGKPARLLLATQGRDTIAAAH
jgi:uncharacterized cupin superfamily protein